MMPLSKFFTKIRTKDFLFGLLLLSIFLINSPPLNILWLSKNLIAKFFIFLIFTILIVARVDYKLNKSKKTTERVLILFFLLQSLSVIKILNLPDFWIKFQNLTFFIILVFIFNRIINRKIDINILIKIIFLSSLLESFFEFLVLNKSFFLTSFLKVSEFNYIKFSYLKEKSDYPNFSYSLIPLIFYFIINNKDEVKIKYKLLSFLLLVLLVYNSLISNNRTFFLMMIFNLSVSLFLYRKKFTTFFKKPLLVFILIVLIYFLKEIALYDRPFTFLTLERMNLNQKNYSTIISRLDIWKRAIEVGNGNILLGIGLGNFSYYLPYSYYIEDHLKKFIYRLNLPPVYTSPHNMFLEFYAEGGIFGFLILIYLFLYLFYIDIRFFISNSHNFFRKSVIFSFWSLFIFLFFNPINHIKFFLYFVIYRSLREI